MHNKNVKRKKANEARLEAIRRKAEQKEKSQIQIREALKGLDTTTSKASHITFSDSDDSVEEVSQHDKNIAPTTTNVSKSHNILGLEDDSDSREETSFALKPQFEGKDGEKLLELQTTYGNDSRFRLDKRFAEEAEIMSLDEEMQTNETEDVTSSKNELAKNMKVLEQVVGNKIKSKNLTKKKSSKFIDTTTRRYDPERNNNLEIEMKKQSPKKVKSKTKKKRTEEPLPAVDNRKFFRTSSNALRSAFGSKDNEMDVSEDEDEPSKPFSFLSMLGRNEDIDDSEKQTNEHDLPDRRFPVPKHGHKSTTQSHVFHHDSSDTEDDDDIEKEINMSTDNIPDAPSKKDETVEECGSSLDFPKTLFMTSPQDKRFLYGPKEFFVKKSFKEMQEEWLAVKDTLIQDYKKKHRDAKRKEKIEAKRLKYESAQIEEYTPQVRRKYLESIFTSPWAD